MRWGREERSGNSTSSHPRDPFHLCSSAFTHKYRPKDGFPRAGCSHPCPMPREPFDEVLPSVSKVLLTKKQNTIKTPTRKTITEIKPSRAPQPHLPRLASNSAFICKTNLFVLRCFVLIWRAQRPNTAPCFPNEAAERREAARSCGHHESSAAASAPLEAPLRAAVGPRAGPREFRSALCARSGQREASRYSKGRRQRSSAIFLP